MANILRYNPADDAFDDLFRGFFMRPVRVEGQPEVQIKMDVSEDDKAYTVHAEIPGVKQRGYSCHHRWQPGCHQRGSQE